MLKFRRQSIRLKNHDYSTNGAYFITICTHNRENFFGNIENGYMQLNNTGQVAEECWKAIPSHFPHSTLDVFIIMPNHVHGIITLNTPIECFSEAKNFSLLPKGTSRTIGSVVRGFKIGVTKWVRQNMQIYNVWQRNYYEHIIRNEHSLRKIREYIINNPITWPRDKLNPENFTLKKIIL